MSSQQSTPPPSQSFSPLHSGLDLMELPLNPYPVREPSPVISRQDYYTTTSPPLNYSPPSLFRDLGSPEQYLLSPRGDDIPAFPVPIPPPMPPIDDGLSWSPTLDGYTPTSPVYSQSSPPPPVSVIPVSSTSRGVPLFLFNVHLASALDSLFTPIPNDLPFIPIERVVRPASTSSIISIHSSPPSSPPVDPSFGFLHLATSSPPIPTAVEHVIVEPSPPLSPAVVPDIPAPVPHLSPVVEHIIAAPLPDIESVITPASPLLPPAVLEPPTTAGPRPVVLPSRHPTRFVPYSDPVAIFKPTSRH